MKPKCKCKCGEPIAIGRARLGYMTCLPCGDREARKMRWPVVSGHKSSFFVVTNPEDLQQLNPKRVGG